MDRAVEAAKRAFDEGPWPRLPASERGRVLNRVADLMEERAEEFALLETLDNGKALAQAMAADVPESINHFRYFAGAADKIQGGAALDQVVLQSVWKLCMLRCMYVVRPCCAWSREHNPGFFRRDGLHPAGADWGGGAGGWPQRRGCMCQPGMEP